MLSVAWKNLWQEKTRFFVSVGGVAASIFLVFLLLGILNGAIEGIVAYPKNMTADLFVMQEGTSNMHMASSNVPATAKSRIKNITGVKDTRGILYLGNTFKTPGGKRMFAYFVGVEPSDVDLAGPWRMAKGSRSPRRNEVIIDEITANKYFLTLGDTIELLDEDFKIIGVSKETFAMANILGFIEKAKLAKLSQKEGLESYIMVWLEPGADRDRIRQTILEKIDDVNVLTREELVASDKKMGRQMSIDLMMVIVGIALVISLLVVSLTIYMATLDRVREYGILKAVGAGNAAVYRVVIFQSFLSSVIGFLLAIPLAHIAFAVIRKTVPEATGFISFGDTFILFVLILLVSAGAAILPVRQISRIDPIIVFNQ